MNAGHRLSRVRLFCMKKIDQVISQYPQMLWNQNLVHLMLDILQYLDSNNLDGVGRKVNIFNQDDFFGGGGAEGGSNSFISFILHFRQCCLKELN